MDINVCIWQAAIQSTYVNHLFSKNPMLNALSILWPKNHIYERINVELEYEREYKYKYKYISIFFYRMIFLIENSKADLWYKNLVFEYVFFFFSNSYKKVLWLWMLSLLLSVSVSCLEWWDEIVQHIEITLGVHTSSTH